jgi:S1-C subfamily serine protease
VKIVVLALLVGCASTRPELPPPEDTGELAAARPVQPAPRRPGVARAELVRTLDAGPGAFLAKVHVRAARDATGFHGWEIVGLDAPYAGGGLAPGDVVTRVNGRVIERPEQLGEVWGGLRGAGEIVVEYLRGGEHRELHVPVLD